MHKTLFILFTLFLLLGTISCGPGYIFDEEGLEIILSYSREILVSFKKAQDDVKYWERNSQDKEIVSRLAEHAETIREIHDRYTDKLPDNDEINKWTLKRRVYDKEFKIPGKILADALETMRNDSIVLCSILKQIAEQEGYFSKEEIRRIVSEIEKMRGERDLFPVFTIEPRL